MPLEIDLRQEFINTLYGSIGETAKGMPVLIRRMRRDVLTFTRTPCVCVDSFSREPDLDHICSYCLGEGFLWDEEWAECYKVAAGSETSLARRENHYRAGRLYKNTYRFYFMYDANLIEGDSIIELVLDVEGEPALPYRRIHKWVPNTIEVKRLDNGRIEFYVVSCQKQNAILIDSANRKSTENP